MTDNSHPATDAKVITPSDTARLEPHAVSLLSDGTGPIVVETLAGSTVTFPATTGVIPIQVVRVLATGTTAASVIGFYYT